MEIVFPRALCHMNHLSGSEDNSENLIDPAVDNISWENPILIVSLLHSMSDVKYAN